MPDLSPAEQAAASRLQYHCNHTGPNPDPDSICGECDDLAREVVGVVAAAVSNEVAERLMAVRAPSSAEQYGLKYAIALMEYWNEERERDHG